MSSHFDYLLQETNTAPSVTQDRLLLMAKTASRRYLNEGTPMNETIAKIAEDNDLNQHQVERVCEMANIATHQSLWPDAPEKEKIAFPVANPKVVIVRKADSSAPPISCPPSVGSDYMGPPSLPSTGPSMASMFGADPGESHSGLHDDGPSKRIIVVLQKKAAEKKAIQDQLIVETMRYESEKLAAYNAIKQEVLSGTPLTAIETAARVANLGKIAAEVLPEFQELLVAETHGRLRTSLEKVAIAPAPEEYISDELGNTTVVNGAHPVLVSLDLLHKRDGTIKALFTGLTRVNDEIKVYGQKIREL